MANKPSPAILDSRTISLGLSHDDGLRAGTALILALTPIGSYGLTTTAAASPSPVTDEHGQQAGVGDDEIVVHRVELPVERHPLMA